MFYDFEKYFSNLTNEQLDNLLKLKDIYSHWNSMINVISRKDIDNFYTHHVLHSLAIAKLIDFVPETTILDVGSGGGFPGIPLAILLPETEFTLLD
jgi:16S rRNA (guanine527-N7)-methyltransferase